MCTMGYVSAEEETHSSVEDGKGAFTENLNWNMIEEFTKLTIYSDKQHGQRPGDAEIHMVFGE